MLKVDRHNYVKVAYHGFKQLEADDRKVRVWVWVRVMIIGLGAYGCRCPLCAVDWRAGRADMGISASMLGCRAVIHFGLSVEPCLLRGPAACIQNSRSGQNGLSH